MNDGIFAGSRTKCHCIAKRMTKGVLSGAPCAVKKLKEFLENGNLEVKKYEKKIYCDQICMLHFEYF